MRQIYNTIVESGYGFGGYPAQNPNGFVGLLPGVTVNPVTKIRLSRLAKPQVKSKGFRMKGIGTSLKRGQLPHIHFRFK